MDKKLTGHECMPAVKQQNKRTAWRENLFHPTPQKRLAFFLILDIFIIIFSLYISFLLRLDFRLSDPYLQLMYFAIPSFLTVKLMSFAYFRLYRLSWRFVGLKELYNILKAVLFSSGALMIGIYFFRFSLFQGFPRGVVVIDAFVTLFLVAFLRILKRAYCEIMRGVRMPSAVQYAIIVGAGNTGEMILRDMQRGGYRNYTPIAFLDDDKNRIDTYLHGVKVMGTIDNLASLVKTYQISAVIIAIPTLEHLRLKQIYEQAKRAGAKEIKIVPRIYDFHRPEIRVHELEDIKIEDLIGRQAVRIDYQEISANLAGKTILVTGAAGSIGFEIVRQVCQFNPGQVVLFEIDETELYQAERVLRREAPEIAKRLQFVVGDTRDFDRVSMVFEQHKPDIVFHAAAYKHVPMMEYNASEAVKVNVLGTYNVARAASVSGVERFVMISTDKAVKPVSIMGATKRLAESICSSFNVPGKMKYLSVRFGNVLGSRGSVLPLFLDQIQKGGPLTITHKDMQRYFMTIPEAVSLVLQASIIGRGGEVMVLDMGQPVKIIDLAEDLLRLHGLAPYKDIDIEVIGIRPGEKLFEEILTAEEGTVSTRHEKIFIAQTKEMRTRQEIDELVERFRNVVRWASDARGKEIVQLLKQCVQGYGGTTVDLSPKTSNLIPLPQMHLQEKILSDSLQ